VSLADVVGTHDTTAAEPSCTAVLLRAMTPAGAVTEQTRAFTTTVLEEN
jgi:hypothetical protein